MRLDGRTALVTGSTSGLGAAIAEALAAAGARIVLNSFTDTASDHDLAAALGSRHGTEAIYLSADLAQSDACTRLVDDAIGRFGTLDILVNNAGIQHVAPIEDFPPEKWDAIVALNLSSAFHTIRAAIPAMKAARWGRIVNIASVHGLIASPYKVAYVAAKHGLIGITKTVALELAEAGITCNAICPAYALTPLVENQIPDQMRAHGLDRETVIRDVMLARQPTKSFVDPADIGAFTVFLCSNSASQITGAALPVDGGWTAL